MGCYPTIRRLAASRLEALGLRGLQEAKLDPQALAFAPELLDQVKRLPLDPEMPPVVLDPLDLINGVRVEHGILGVVRALRPEQAGAAIVKQQLLVYARKPGCGA